MTIQADEVIEYRGKEFSLTPYPLANYLEKYLEDRKDLAHILNFIPTDSDLWRGYQGYWKIKDNKLYLNKIERSGHTIECIFNSPGPIHADWYTGILYMGFGDGESDDWGIYYKNHLWLNVKCGIIQDRKIIKRVHDKPLQFGIYKGQTILEIIQGKLNSIGYKEHLFKNYINELLNYFLIKDYKHQIITPHIPISKDTKLFDEQLNTDNIKYLLSKNFLAIEKHFYSDYKGEEETELFSTLMENILSSNFRT